MAFNNSNCKVLRLGWGNPTHEDRLGEEFLKNSPAEKDFGVLLDEKFNMSQQPVLHQQRIDQQVEGGDCPPLF